MFSLLFSAGNGCPLDYIDLQVLYRLSSSTGSRA